MTGFSSRTIAPFFEVTFRMGIRFSHLARQPANVARVARGQRTAVVTMGQRLRQPPDRVLGDRTGCLFFALRIIPAHMRWSGSRDLNPGPHGPKPCALPSCATPRRGVPPMKREGTLFFAKQEAGPPVRLDYKLRSTSGQTSGLGLQFIWTSIDYRPALLGFE